MNNVKTSKIVNIQGSGTFETQHGQFFNFDMLLENGDSGEYDASRTRARGRSEICRRGVW